MNYMGFLSDNCVFTELTSDNVSICSSFSCGNEDLDSFFRFDALNYSDYLLGKTYLFTLSSDSDKVVAAFTISNDSLRLEQFPNSRGKKFRKTVNHQTKPLMRYPGVLIGRLGVSQDFAHRGIGRELMDIIKIWFRYKNKTGCRFLIVDAYNNPETLGYYERNGFDYLFSSENQEALYTRNDANEPMRTRLMFFDLISLLISE